jgi:hypothetical protein
MASQFRNNRDKLPVADAKREALRVFAGREKVPKRKRAGGII